MHRSIGTAFAIVFAFVCLCAALSDSQKQESSVSSNQNVSHRKSDVETKAEARTKKVKEQFGWWGNWVLTEMIKMSMNDPKSFEHVKTTYIDYGTHLMVTTTFRGKNGFGGVVKQRVVAKVDLNCDGSENGIRIISVE